MKIKNLKQYDLPGTKDKNGNRKDKSYQDPNTWKMYQEDFIKFKQFIIENEKPKVLLRAYDGEFWFLKKKKVGNVGTRHVSIDINDNIVKKFYNNSLKCDKFASHLTVMPNGGMHKLYSSVYGNKKIDYPMEFHYAIVLNKWIFKNFKNQIGLIGGKEKIKLIKELIKYKEYRDYLGIDFFTDYVEIPERFGCDDTEKLELLVKEQLKNSKAKIFLFGIGICKLAIAYKFKDFYPATYIDIGGLLTGLAGFLSRKRPYAFKWTNFRIKNYDYSKIDPIDFNINHDKIKYL